ncbi:hypothetical protein G7Y89_g3197 [Cudoniella acicularis]|uniref:Uncharacterized protein n=1 Tax=Cudoniella acicularis TaxID=354080 RepID=A0A8H4RSQ2_9HELO|nr:hypothetical protein G7Y89_g3197 [Cudoniella acicularis]
MAALRFVRSVLRSFQAESGLEPRLFGDNVGLSILQLPWVLILEEIVSASCMVELLRAWVKCYYEEVLVTYLNSGGQVGDVLKGVVKCDKFGKTLAYTSAKFINSKGEIAARGSHTKYVALAWKHPENIVEELSPRKQTQSDKP